MTNPRKPKVFTFSDKHISLSKQNKLCVHANSKWDKIAEEEKALLTNPHHLAKQGDAKTISKLAAYKVNLEAKDDLGYTPLFYAVQHNNSSVIKTLMKCNIKVDAPSLALALDKDRDVVRILLNIPLESRLPISHYIVRYHKDGTAFKQLLECKFNFDKLHKETMVVAAQHNKVEMMKTLMECGVSLNQNEVTEAAIENHSLDVIKLLMAHNLEINKKNEKALSPLQLAASQGRCWDLVAIMLKLNPINVTDGVSCAIAAVTENNLDAIKKLIELEVKLTDKDPRACQLMRAAISNNNVEMICLMANLSMELAPVIRNHRLAIIILLKLPDKRILTPNTLALLHKSRLALKNTLIEYLKSQNKEALLEIQKSMLAEKNALAQVLAKPKYPLFFKLTCRNIDGKPITGSLFAVAGAITTLLKRADFVEESDESLSSNESKESKDFGGRYSERVHL